MPTVNDNFQTVAAAWVMDNRIRTHVQPGGMLAGLKYDAEGTQKVDGHDDLPMMQPWTIAIETEASGGAPRGGSQSALKGNQPVAETLTLVFRIATARKNGWMRRDATDASSPLGLLEWLALIRDAFERNIDGQTVDSNMLASAMKPVAFRCRESETSQLSFTVFLEVDLALRHHCRSERAHTLPEN